MGKYIHETTDAIEDVLRGMFETLLGFCKYYKGEESNPYDKEDTNKAMLWFYERCWVHNMNNYGDGYFHSIIGEYNSVGLKDFEKGDGVPYTLKALMFNRYCKGCFSMTEDVEPFKEFYRMFYLNEL